jgi:hypothetical protein
MQNHETDEEMVAASAAALGGRQVRPTLSRRQALGRMSAVATAGAAAWVMPEILTAKPASGATLSGSVGTTGTTGTTGTGASVGVGVSTSAGTTGGSDDPSTGASTTASGGTAAGTGTDPGASTLPSTLAFTGLDIKRDAEVGAALVAGGWAMHHWASRLKSAPALDAEGEAGSAGRVP